MIFKLYNFCGVLFVIFAMSCTERMDLEPNSLAIYLSVEATLTNEAKAHTVKLTRTKLIMDTEIPTISSALVTISDGLSEFILTESDSFSGLYLTTNNFSAIPGTEYTLKIEDVDINNDGVFETYLATALMPIAIEIDSVTVEPFILDVFRFSGWSLKCWALDPPEKNYYLFKAWVNNTLVSDTLYEYNFTDDTYFNGQYTNGIECQILDNSKTDEKLKDGDLVALELCNISKEFFEYLNATATESRPSVPMFSGPPANAPSNISGGAVGFFRVYYTVKGFDVVKIESK